MADGTGQTTQEQRSSTGSEGATSQRRPDTSRRASQAASPSLRGKVALVTGGASGIGLATARLMAERGAEVVIVDLKQDTVDKVVDREADDKIAGVTADVSKEKDVERMVGFAVDTFGGLDIAVNNAGIGGPAALLADYPLTGWESVLKVNLTGVFLGMRYEIPQLLERGGGSIVNVASILGHVGFAQSCAYVAAKHGVVGLTQNAALEYASQGIRVNAIAPGFIETPLLEGAGITKESDVHRLLVTQHPIGRLGQAEEIAAGIVWLASDEARFVNGTSLAVDGGYLAR